MALSNDIISQFAKLTNSNKETKTESTLYGTIVISDGKKYVRLDGSNIDTPISSTANVKQNDRVMVMIKNHAAIVTGNITSPSADQQSVDDLNDKTDDMSNQITKFGIIVSYKISTDDITALNATFESMKSITGKFTELDAVTAEIETLQAQIASLEYLSATDIEAINAEIENIKANFGTFTGISTEDVEAFNAEIVNLTARVGNFTYVSTEVLKAMKADIKNLDVNKLSAEQADLKYANIDFSNIGEAAITKVFSDSGIIKDLIVSGGKITGELVGVTIKGDLIEGNTIKADKLVVKGSDGIYYKLNFEGGTFSEGEEVPTDGLHGSVIVANSITAEKISVDDLVAFGATIGGFNITNDSIYSGVKSSVDNTTRGIYLDNDGQIALGDSNGGFKYYKDQNGDYKLEIAARSIIIGTSNKNVEEIVEAAYNKADNAEKQTVIQSDTEPSLTTYMWLDTSVEPALLKRYNSETLEWEAINDTSSLNTALSELEQHVYTEITNTEESIISTVAEQYYLKSEAEQLTTEMSTQIIQTAKDLSIQFDKFNTDLEDLTGKTDYKFEEIQKYIRFNDGKILLGESGNQLELVISNDRILFTQNKTPVAYFSNNKLYVIDGEFTRSLRLGNFAYLPRTNGNLSFKKI